MTVNCSVWTEKSKSNRKESQRVSKSLKVSIKLDGKEPIGAFVDGHVSVTSLMNHLPRPLFNNCCYSVLSRLLSFPSLSLFSFSVISLFVRFPFSKSSKSHKWCVPHLLFFPSQLQWPSPSIWIEAHSLAIYQVCQRLIRFCWHNHKQKK